jgi:hypothetical protein
MGGGSGKLAGREGAVSPISWWPVTRLKVSMVVIVRSNARVVWCAGDVRGGWDWSPGGSVGLGCRIGCEVGRSVVTGSLLALGILVTYGAPVGAAHMVAVNAACRRASAGDELTRQVFGHLSNLCLDSRQASYAYQLQTCSFTVHLTYTYHERLLLSTSCMTASAGNGLLIKDT